MQNYTEIHNEQWHRFFASFDLQGYLHTTVKQKNTNEGRIPRKERSDQLPTNPVERNFPCSPETPILIAAVTVQRRLSIISWTEVIAF